MCAPRTRQVFGFSEIRYLFDYYHQQSQSTEMASFNNNATRSQQGQKKKYQAKLCFLLDTTGSMQHVRDSVVSFVDEIVHYCTTTYPIDLSLSIVGYKDIGDQNQFQKRQFTKDLGDFKTFLSGIHCTGGGDEAENVLGGMNELLTLNWDNAEVKALIHIGDSPHHGSKFHGGLRIHDDNQDHENQPRPYEDILADISDNHIDYTFVQVKNPRGEITTSGMLQLFEQAYNSNPSRKSNFAAFPIGEYSAKDLLAKVKSSLSNSIQSFMRSLSSSTGGGGVVSKKPAVKECSGLPTSSEEKSTSTTTSVSEGMDLALGRFSLKDEDGEPAPVVSKIPKEATTDRKSPSSMSTGSVSLGMKRAESSVSSKPVSVMPSGSISIGMGGKKPTESSVVGSIKPVATTTTTGSISIGMGKKPSEGSVKPAVPVTTGSVSMGMEKKLPK
jgi:hypothetical protein